MEIKTCNGVSLTSEDIDNILCTALDTISYWCSKAMPIGGYKGKYASEQISRGGTLEFYDAEDEDNVYELNLDKFMSGVSMYVNEYGKFSVDELDGRDADCIIQFALFGELMFS